MIIKKRELPLVILKLQALIRRLPASHPRYQEIKDQLSRRLAGYRGEKAIDYQLSFLPEKDFYILNDLRLFTDKHHFQIDTLLITRNCIFILEVKNIAGSIYFDPYFHQLVRHLDGKEAAFQDPVIQSQRQMEQLTKWLSKNQFPNIPIVPLVVISSSNTLIRTSPENTSLLSEKVMTGQYLPVKLQQLLLTFKQDILDEKQLKKLYKLLMKRHREYEPSVIESFHISLNDILRGVICPKCGHMPMDRGYGTWQCSKCLHKCKNAHIEAFQDYSLLFGPSINNRQAREFLKTSSITLASRLLSSLHSPSNGTTKDRVYHLTWSINEQKNSRTLKM